MTPVKSHNVIASAVAQKNHLTVQFGDGKTFSVDSSQPTFAKLKKALKSKNGATARMLVNAAEAINTWAKGKLTVDKLDNVLYDGKVVDPKLHARILKMVHAKAPVTNLVKFLDKLNANPSADAIQDLYSFLLANDLPICEDGDFLAFRVVAPNWTDKFTGKMNNNVGQTPKMRREDCNPNRHETCSSGLHFCRKGYIESYMNTGDHLTVVKISPFNITSIPTDYKQSKGRCCEFYVLAEVKPGFNIDEVLRGITENTRKLEERLGVPVEKRQASVKKAKKKLAKKQAKKQAKAVRKTKKALKKVVKKAPKKASGVRVKKGLKKATTAVKKAVKKATKKAAYKGPKNWWGAIQKKMTQFLHTHLIFSLLLVIVLVYVGVFQLLIVFSGFLRGYMKTPLLFSAICVLALELTLILVFKLISINIG